MTLNFLQKSLTRLSDAQNKYNTARSTEFVKYINKSVTDLSEVASQALENTEAAYNKYLQDSNQPVSNEIKDLQNYAKDLSKKPLNLDLANSPAVNATLTEEIEKDNEEATAGNSAMVIDTVRDENHLNFKEEHSCDGFFGASQACQDLYAGGNSEGGIGATSKSK